MKFLLVSTSDSLKPFLERSFNHQAAEVIHYDNPIKAMDNIDEIEPDVVFFAATDYPRHWKPFVMYLRNSFSRRESIFILMISDSFPTEEADKAEYLQVNAILDEDLSSRQTIERIGTIISRYHRSNDIRRFIRFIPTEVDRVAFTYTNPFTFSIVGGRVLDISTGGLRFEPVRESETTHLDLFTVVSCASLRLGTSVIPIKVKVMRVDRSIGFEFIDLTLETETAIITYLDQRSERDLAFVVSEDEVTKDRFAKDDGSETESDHNSALDTYLR